jgi:acyl phosphate:glycerol-3-phosphate acyltransferase
MSTIFLLLLGYLSGSIPFGLLLTRTAGLGDIRSIGSGNIGATNVLRTGSKKLAALTLACDCLKGLLPVLAAKYWGGGMDEVVAGFAALAGHVFPVWLKFKGGKGVATGLGVLLGWHWIFGLAFIAAWIVIFLITRISSVAALAASLVAAVVAYLSAEPIWALSVLALAAVVWLTHRSNIGRLLKGAEPKSTFTRQ